MTGRGLVTWAEGAVGGQSGSNAHKKMNDTFRSEFFPVFAGLIYLLATFVI